MPKGDSIGNYFIGKNPPTVDVVEENLLGKIAQDDDGGLVFEDIDFTYDGKNTGVQYFDFVECPVKEFKNCSLKGDFSTPFISFARCNQLTIDKEHVPFLFDESNGQKYKIANGSFQSVKRINDFPFSYNENLYGNFYHLADGSGTTILSAAFEHCYFKGSRYAYDGRDWKDYADKRYAFANTTIDPRFSPPWKMIFKINAFSNTDLSYSFYNVKSSTSGCLPIVLEVSEAKSPIESCESFNGNVSYMFADSDFGLYDDDSVSSSSGTIWGKLYENITTCQGTFKNCKKLYSSRYNIQNYPLIFRLLPRSASDYSSVFENSNYSGSTIGDISDENVSPFIFTNRKNQTINAERMFYNCEGLTDLYLGGVGYKLLAYNITNFDNENLKRIKFQYFDEIIMLPTLNAYIQIPTHINYLNFDRVRSVSCGAFKTDCPSGELKLIFNNTVLLNQGSGLIECDNLQPQITGECYNLLISPDYDGDFTIDYSCFPNLTRYTLINLLSNLYESNNRTKSKIILNSNVFPEKTVDTIYVYGFSTQTNNNKIAHTIHGCSETPISGGMTLKEWLTTYHPGLSVEFIEKK